MAFYLFAYLIAANVLFLFVIPEDDPILVCRVFAPVQALAITLVWFSDGGIWGNYLTGFAVMGFACVIALIWPIYPDVTRNLGPLVGGFIYTHFSCLESGTKQFRAKCGKA